MGVEDVYSVGRVLGEVIADRSGRASTRRGRAERLLGSDGPQGRIVVDHPALRPPAAEVLAALGRDVDRTAGTRHARSGGDARSLEGLCSFDYRFEQLLGRWYQRPSLSAYLDGRAEPAESREAYAFLHARGTRAWLRPFETFRHFASAIGSKAVADDRGDTFDKVFPRGVRPRRVLDPLAAIFAMSGLLGEDAAKEVGT